MRMVLLLVFLCAGASGMPGALGHTTVSVPPYEIEVGWGTEPPVVGIRNSFVFHVSEPGETEGVSTGTKSAFKEMDAMARFGGITKQLEISTDPRPGHYYSPVIPTSTGSYSIHFTGSINGVLVDVEVPVEDVETTAVLDFPPREGGASDAELASIKNALRAMQADIDALDSGGIEDAGLSYDYAVFGISLGAAGIVLGVISMIKRKSGMSLDSRNHSES